MNFAIYTFTALLLIVNPVVNVPIFMSILERFNKKDRKNMVRRSVIIAAIVLIIMTLTGAHIFRFLGIDMYSFRIAGGILLFVISMEMLFGGRSKTESSDEEQDEARRRDDVVVTPMAVPLLTGPGAITTGIVLFNSAVLIEEKLILIFCIVLVFAVTYFILARADAIFNTLGYTGTKVVVRVMGLLLAAIAVQFIILGIREAVSAVS